MRISHLDEVTRANTVRRGAEAPLPSQIDSQWPVQLTGSHHRLTLAACLEPILSGSIRPGECTASITLMFNPLFSMYSLSFESGDGSGGEGAFKSIFTLPKLLLTMHRRSCTQPRHGAASKAHRERQKV